MNRRPVLLLLLLFGVVMLLAIACKQVSIAEYHVEKTSCNGCGECIRICPFDAITFDQNGKAVIDQTKCTQCANCVAVCPNSAIY